MKNGGGHLLFFYDHLWKFVDILWTFGFLWTYGNYSIYLYRIIANF